MLDLMIVVVAAATLYKSPHRIPRSPAVLLFILRALVIVRVF